jgi:pimeloyl-ACP methyl ester carboxylesterase
MRRLYCIWAVLGVLAPGGPAAASGPPAAAREVGHYAGDGPAELVRQPQAAPDTTGYTIFLRGAPVGREDVTIQIGAEGTTVTSQGRLSAPFNAVTRLAEFRYAPDWSAQLFVLDGTSNGAPVTIRTTFAGGVATSQGVQGPAQIDVAHPVAAQTIVLPNGIFSGYAALALRLASVKAGAELRAYILPQMEIALRVAGVTDEQMQLGNTILKVRRYDLVFANPGGDLSASLTASETGRLIRINVGAQGLDVVRDDVAATTSRTQVFANPGDEPVTIPAAGFNLGATLTRPASGPARLPAVILLSGPAVGDREGFALGVPLFGQLAGALADAGFLAVRYDKRGNGQSGGRSESATIRDYADDARSVFDWLEDRRDVDPDRIALIGHGDGAWIALLTAARERDVAAVVTFSGPATPGTELNLEQQQLALDRSTLTPAERDARIALQKQIQSAVLTGKGWDTVPPELRRQADTPWFQSFLAFEPAEVIEDVRAPLLLVHPALDREVPAAHVERLAELAKTESDSKAVEVVVVRGVNHLLLPATTGEVVEYGTLTDRAVSTDVTAAVTGWLTKTFAAIR